MNCPRCMKRPLVTMSDGTSECVDCGLTRRKPDNITISEKTNFRILNRNVARTPTGSLVSINVLSAATGFVLKSSNLLCIAFSYDMEDLILLAAENGWEISDKKLQELSMELRK